MISCDPKHLEISKKHIFLNQIFKWEHSTYALTLCCLIIVEIQQFKLRFNGIENIFEIVVAYHCSKETSYTLEL